MGRMFIGNTDSTSLGIRRTTDPQGRYGKELRRTSNGFSSELFTDEAVRFLRDREGKSLNGIMTGKQESVREEIFAAYRDVQRAIRTERWKLIRYPQINRTQLFDLPADPHEIRNLADESEQEQRVTEMMVRLADLQQQYDDKLPLTSDDPRPAEINLSEPSR